IEQFSLTNLTLISIRYFTLLKLEQQKIRSLTQTEDISIKNDVNTLDFVKQRLENYKQLIDGINIVFNYLIKLDAPEEQHKKVIELYSLCDLYRQETQALTEQVAQLETYQKNLLKAQSQKTIISTETQDETSNIDSLPIIGWIVMSLVIMGLLVVLFSRRRTQ
ncbi:MAG: hypothetical protein VSS52_009120, partial [Thiotrichaceae bacterium]|nr:hypothetical protein [Thiotrichaceae bacterium]